MRSEFRSEIITPSNGRTLSGRGIEPFDRYEISNLKFEIEDHFRFGSGAKSGGMNVVFARGFILHCGE